MTKTLELPHTDDDDDNNNEVPVKEAAKALNRKGSLPIFNLN